MITALIVDDHFVPLYVCDGLAELNEKRMKRVGDCGGRVRALNRQLYDNVQTTAGR